MTIDELIDELIDTEIFYTRYGQGKMSHERADSARSALRARIAELEDGQRMTTSNPISARTVPALIDRLRSRIEGMERELHNANFTISALHEENQAVRMELMPILESEEPAPYVKALNERIAELEKGRTWISVGERLPDINGKYLIYRQGKFDTSYFWLSQYDYWKNDGVTHWLSIPPAPE